MASPIVIVTGANRGIGFAIIQATALRVPKATYILACRSLPSGLSAIDELRKLGVTAALDVVELDVTDNTSILSATRSVGEKYRKLDILVNNAGVAIPLSDPTSLPSLRHSFTTTLSSNITSVAAVTTAFLPLLRLSSHPRVIHISSGRASLTRSTTGMLPPTAVVAYSVSKVALNALMVEQQKGEDYRGDVAGGKGNGQGENGKVDFYAINPGHCKTAFNGWRGTKDPLEGAEVVVRLVEAERGAWNPGSFLECEDGEMRAVPW